MADITLTEKQAAALEAFCDAFDQCTTGQWRVIARYMTEELGIESPESALNEAREVLRS